MKAGNVPFVGEGFEEFATATKPLDMSYFNRPRTQSSPRSLPQRQAQRQQQAGGANSPRSDDGYKSDDERDYHEDPKSYPPDVERDLVAHRL